MWKGGVVTFWRKWRRQRKASIRKGGVLAEIRTEYLAIQI
jgi:hypothetical protein